MFIVFTQRMSNKGEYGFLSLIISGRIFPNRIGDCNHKTETILLAYKFPYLDYPVTHLIKCFSLER